MYVQTTTLFLYRYPDILTNKKNNPLVPIIKA